jgi:N,N'-diacetyllegionaminate synthase
MSAKVHIIAEAGTTHEGEVGTALQLVDAAKAAGADSIKFQLIDPPELYVLKIWQDGKLADNPAIAAREAQRISPEGWRAVAAHAGKVALPFSASIFGLGTLGFLVSLSPPYVKLASADTNNIPLIEAAIATGRTVLLSTGMSPLGEIEASVERVARRGGNLVLLHCVSQYPCPPEQANVGFIATLKQAFGLPVGYSDHTESSVSAIAAVALGATWLEKHMTLDRKTPKGFDHAYAMEPRMLAAYIRDIRAAEAALAVQSPKVGAGEAKVRERARRGLFATADLQPGHVLQHSDMIAVRPAGPYTPADIETLIGRKLALPIRAHEPIRPEALAIEVA